MNKAPFSLFRRRDKNGKPLYSARFVNEQGQVIRTVALRTASKVEAARRADKLLADGIVAQADNPLLNDFLAGFWKMDSEYVRGRILRGKSISENYVIYMRKIAERLFSESFKGLHVTDLTPGRFDTAILKAAEVTGPRCVNIGIQAIKVPLAWYARQHRVINPIATVQKITYAPKERGSLSAKEVYKIIHLEGESPRVMAAVLLGALCGLRLGEVRGLQWEDVDEADGTISIRHNAPCATDTLKAPKWGSSRVVPASETVLEALRLVRGLPGASTSYVVFNQKSKDRPIEENTIARGFFRILEKIGIDKDTRKARSLTFHSLRHTFVSLSRAAGVPDFVVMRLSGHRSAEMMEEYSHSDNVVDFQAARKAMDDAISKAGKAKA